MSARQFLVATDFSDPSKRAIAAAKELAAAVDGKITLLHVNDSNAFVPPQSVLRPSSGPEDEEAAKSMLDALRDELVPDAESVVLVHRAPARAICDFAESNDFDTIVVGSVGYGPVERWLIGSVAERVVRHATCSVFVIR
ncbi:MAG: universal stress protein [Myxococcota bacterium]